MEMDERLATRRARPLVRPAELLGRRDRRPRAPRLRRRRAARGRARAPTWSPSGSTRARTAGADPAQLRASPRPPPTSTRWSSTADVVVSGGGTALGDVGRAAGRRRSEPLWRRRPVHHAASRASPAIARARSPTTPTTTRSGILARRRRRRRGRARSPGSGPAARRPPADRRVDVGGRAVRPRASSTPTPTWSSPATARPSSPPGWRASATPAAASARPSPPPAPPTDEQLARRAGRARSPRCARQGTTTVEIKSGYGLTVADEARSLRHRRRSSPRRRPSSARTSCPPEYAGPGRRTSTWSPARCSTPAPRTPAGSTCSASAGAFDGDQARAVLAAGPRRGAAGCGVHANQLGPGPGVAAGRRARRGQRRPLHLPRPTPTSTRSPAAAPSPPCCPASSSPPARPTRTPAGCSTPASRSRWPRDCNPGSCYTVVDAAAASRSRSARWG